MKKIKIKSEIKLQIDMKIVIKIKSFIIKNKK